MLHKDSTLSIVKTRTGRPALSPLEVKVFCFLLGLLDENGDPALSFDLKDCAAACGAAGTDEVLPALCRLSEEVVEEKYLGVIVSIPLMQDFRYQETADTAMVLLNERLVPALRKVDRERLFCSSGCNTEYSRRLYAMAADLLGNKKEVKFDMALEDLRTEIGADSPSYINFGIFRERALDPAVATVSETSDVTVSYEYMKQGRRISGIRFKVAKKKGWKRDTVAKTEKRGGAKKNNTDRVQALVAPKQDTGKTARVMSRLVRKPVAIAVAMAPVAPVPAVSGLLMDFDDEEETIF